MNLLDITTATIDWSRAQFALTAIYHWLFVPLTLGLAIIMGIMETCYYRTRKIFWKDAARFWQRLFGINFAMGVATGIILEFEFGTNWSNYSWFVGDIFGTPLAIEGIFAFFMEATFVAVMFFGWKKVSPGFHLASTWLTGLGATLSAWWILVANAWMQDPIGSVFNPDTMRFEMSSFAKIALSPFAVDKFFHTVISSWIIGAVFCVAVSGWYLLKHREEKLAKESIKIAAIVGLVSSVLTVLIGDNSAVMVSKVQPMKLASMEALYHGGNDQALTVVAAVNPFKQPDYEKVREAPMKVGVPDGLSLLATRKIHGYVPGINELLNGYTLPDGTREPSVEQKMAMGKKAIAALVQYRKGKKDAVTKKTVMDNIKYFGYGYVKNPRQVVPFIPVNFWAFRVMVGIGFLLVLFFIVDLFMVYKKDISRYRWLQVVSIIFLPLTYLASESGWLVAEFGRQPWTIQDMLPTWVAVSDLHSGSVALTFFIFLALFTTMLTVEICILFKQIKKGPEHTEKEIVKVDA
ncbi:MAG: cytochrome ubiquinol oxidase subunit I [Prevotella sp.]|jgi:cytochrome d ubiquinol oxidase subunit I|nr:MULTISPECIES: cytochrome ubiquinol oxidase subunit I [unclassified Prevotella]MCH3969943.1 cytochrome ubiquinol oxidase subunit I [Prevotella sp.]MCH3984641.1 cytochrome ubiquinol oxidase subunit I [Prevotella sp.]MCH3991249.1 cytochrome ubiquinol oxidase subunit I [Prevotella sp.]MCH4018417.1 cytochrome ubiquinol oxidase subunit I [Prevotella sp.]MCH4100485.1 cytochrome ubiquinol oxidase subunit I [Prevotella sp.]